MNLAIIKYNAGNIQSVLYALERLGVQAVVTDKAEEILSADKVIFPGVGEASSAMQSLRENRLDELILEFANETIKTGPQFTELPRDAEHGKDVLVE